MPLPRRSTINRATKKKPAKKRTTTTRAKKGERLLVTCAPMLTDYMVEDIADTLHGSFFTDDHGRYQQVVAVRIDGHKVYGTLREMFEASPYMFAPV